MSVDPEGGQGEIKRQVRTLEAVELTVHKGSVKLLGTGHIL